ncbi:MAG: S41 family peptidase [Verrucomicrobia bacterium]|nr:S41 family peptidase [Verrucomicrobiota bacterium]
MSSLFSFWLVGFFLFGLSAWAAPEGAKTNSPTQTEEGRYRSALLFANVVELIRDAYLDPEKTDYDKMTYAALRGLLSSLDPHSQFLDPENYKLIRTETEGQFGGLGISIGLVENQLTINVPIEGGPAYRAGLLPGDRILKIEGHGTQKLTLGEAIRKLRGRPGAPVQLTIYRPSDAKMMEVSVVREMIQVPTIQDVGLISESTARGEKIGYLRITQFGERTDKEFDVAITRLEKEGATALILDLRDNPGGLVDAAVQVVSRFVPNGTLVVATEGRKATVGRVEYLSRTTARRVHWPTVVLVNGNTASAAEIVAGALQDLGKAVLLGETTFGKGSVQTVQRVDPSVTQDVGVRLTTAHYTTPSRRKIHGVGIEPDITARMTRAEEQTIFSQRSPGLKKPDDPVAEIQDEPLDRAVDLLRGWKVVARRSDPTR